MEVAGGAWQAVCHHPPAGEEPSRHRAQPSVAMGADGSLLPGRKIPF